ncbi:MAG: copper chaperone PCu(A)C [Chloroflexi bacterium]|uniref:Copper chaperone PCu(A)C n=1 Tax=Candidatus Chlorohelix allophototropha TaxID=3003348 RepID=A0A8T7M9S8_9CHLR|nr:copper chaperone PCu(A)C [Chloroflexota bacterium]WJW68713.1 copper chaperone PCu(A)C [Chloroflexota bacterium L227-S17]
MRFFKTGSFFMVLLLVLAACGDNTATPVPAATTAAATTAAGATTAAAAGKIQVSGAYINAPKPATTTMAGGMATTAAATTMAMGTPGASAMVSTGMFLTINNSGAEADKLLGGQTSIADAVEVHTFVNSKMVLAETAPVPANGSLTLAPGGLHIMLIGVKQPLTVGQKVSVTLNFEKAGKVIVEAEVRAS